MLMILLLTTGKRFKGIKNSFVFFRTSKVAILLRIIIHCIGFVVKFLHTHHLAATTIKHSDGYAFWSAFNFQHSINSRELDTIADFGCLAHNSPPYMYGVTFNAEPIATRPKANRLGFCANIAEPAIAIIKPIKATSGAYWCNMRAPYSIGVIASSIRDTGA